MAFGPPAVDLVQPMPYTARRESMHALQERGGIMRPGRTAATPRHPRTELGDGLPGPDDAPTIAVVDG